jgi:hypothetical protein
MSKTVWRYCIFTCAFTLLAACNDNDGNSNNGSNPPSQSAREQVKSIAIQQPDTEPNLLTDTATLENNLNQVFGMADQEPLEVDANDTPLTLINRL